MLFSVFYLSLFLSVGLLLARRAVPDGSAAVIVPLGCGFGVSLLAVLRSEEHTSELQSHHDIV